MVLIEKVNLYGKLNGHESCVYTVEFNSTRDHLVSDDKAKNPSLLSNINKENLKNNENKSELPKLSLDPQQMKRKKKGGYNLRKSLAWDRAFFTEEGVLNSKELSLINGNVGKLRGEKLSLIEEERRESLSGDSPDLQALEDNLFTELPLNSSSNKKVEKKIGRGLLQKSSGSAPRSTVKQNVLSVQDVNKSGSKRSAVNGHRSTGLTGSNRSTRSTQNDAKSSLSSRSHIAISSAQPAKRNVRISELASHSSTSSQHPLVTKADNGLKVNQVPVMAAGNGSINHEADSSKIASLPQSGCHIDQNTQYAQPRMAKPSGLRMPSPSLGFFTLSKTNASHNLQSSTQPCNNPKSNIPNLRKLGVLNSICESPTPIKIDVVANDAAAITHARMSSTEPSVPSSANSLCENIRPNSRESKMPRVEVKFPCNSDNYELTNNQQQLHTNDNDLKKQIENIGLQCTDNKLLLQSQFSEQVKFDCKRRADLVILRSPDQNGDEFKDPHFISHQSLQIKGALMADDVGSQLSGNEQHNSLMEDFDLFPQLHSIDVNSSNLHGSPKVNDDQINIHDCHEQSSKQAEQAKPFTFDDDDHIFNEIERPHINEGTLLKEGEPSEEFLSYNSVQSKGICPEARDRSASELERANGLSHYRDRIQGKDGAGGADDLNLQSHVGEQMKAFEGNLSLESSSDLLNASEVENHHTLINDVITKLVEQPQLLDPCIVVERVFEGNYGSRSTDCLLHGEIFSSEELLAESNLQSVKDVASELADACRSEMANSIAPCWIPPTMQNCVYEMAEVVECLHVENAVSVSTDTPCNLDIVLLCEAISKGLEGIREDQVIGAITACDIGVSNDCQISRDLNGGKMDNSHSISHLSPVVKIKGYSEVDDIIDLKSVEGNQYCLSAKCNSSISEPGEKITSRHVEASAVLTNSSIDKQNDSEKSIAQAELIESFEAGKAFQENQIPEACLGLLSVEGKYGEESQNFSSDNRADGSSRDKSSFRRAAGGPSDLSQVEQTDEPNERCAAEANEMTTRPFGEDLHLQSFIDGISFDNCKSNLLTSAENNSFAVVEDLNKPPELQNIVIVEPIMSDKFGLSCNEEISSYVKIKLSDNNHDYYNDMIRPENEQSDQASSLNFESSSLSEDQISGAGNSCKSQAFFSLNEESTSSIKTNHTSSSGNVLQEDVNRLENDVPLELNGAMIPVEDKGRTTSFEKIGNNKKQDAPVLKPPLNAVPFSDEWLAAFEDAGEEILTLKSGAVQNSPKDKSLPEPGPWSPVRRKNNQDIGPFDCTKFTNTNILYGSD
ncbi:hypothetical protein CRYUN_Cryun02cG0155600 [Craigia yunnanensis]